MSSRNGLALRILTPIFVPTTTPLRNGGAISLVSMEGDGRDFLRCSYAPLRIFGMRGTREFLGMWHPCLLG
jgi:hypothetical protein